MERSMVPVLLLPPLLIAASSQPSPVTQEALECVRRAQTSKAQFACIEGRSIPFLELGIVTNEIRRLSKLRDAPNSEGECPIPADESGRYVWRRFTDPEVLGCLLRAADTGRDLQAVEWAQVIYWEGRVGTGPREYIEGLFPRNEARLRKYIDLGVARGAPRSILAKAAFLQDVAPVVAYGLYRHLAIDGDCRAQLMIAWMHLKGVGTAPNPAKAYFWTRLAVRNDSIEQPKWLEIPVGEEKQILAGSHPIPYFDDRVQSLFGSPQPVFHGHEWFEPVCKEITSAARGVIDLELLSKAPFADEVYDLLLSWRKGMDAPAALDKHEGTVPTLPVTKHEPPRKKPPVPPRVARTVATWKPIRPISADRAAGPLPIPDLYEDLTKSVYVIVAAPSAAALARREDLAQGSAVAVSANQLVTNCHIIEGRPAVALATRAGLVPLNVAASRFSADTCVLAATAGTLAPIARMRTFESLRVGETVFAIGSPAGFVNTLSTGIISQLRTADARRLIQTDAAISGGSSGGGLFDASGHLIGVTTFKIRDTEGLNFAIAIDEYLH
jgi:serine protease Do